MLILVRIVIVRVDEMTIEDKQKQRRSLTTCLHNRYTNSIDESDTYRTPLACEARTYELHQL